MAGHFLEFGEHTVTAGKGIVSIFLKLTENLSKVWNLSINYCFRFLHLFWIPDVTEGDDFQDFIELAMNVNAHTNEMVAKQILSKNKNFIVL